MPSEGISHEDSQRSDLTSFSIAELLRHLGTTANGLSAAEAGERLARHCPNEIPEETVNPILKFLSYFWGPIPWMIEVAAVLSAVLFFMTLSILVFNFYPVTAVMIVLLALLNDGAILSIAYDRVRYSDRPEAWNMPIMLGIATMLGITGVMASFGLFYLGERVFNLSLDIIQSFMYLRLETRGESVIWHSARRSPVHCSRPNRSGQRRAGSRLRSSGSRFALGSVAGVAI